jgi:hypothetical protein
MATVPEIRAIEGELKVPEDVGTDVKRSGVNRFA